MLKWLKFHKVRELEKGQALSEYSATFPLMILVGVVLGGAMGPGLVNAYQEIVNSFKTCPTAEVSEPEGKTTAELGEHTIELVVNYYDEETDTTHVSYKVTSGGDPSISHWVLGLPEGAEIDNWGDFADEQPSWVENDPSAPNGEGISGLKFDKGYESTGDNGGGNPGNDKEKDNPGRGRNEASTLSLTNGYTLTFSPYYETQQQELITDSRTIGLILVGAYDFIETEVAVKAGGDYYTTTILAPMERTTYVDEYGNELVEGCE